MTYFHYYHPVSNDTAVLEDEDTNVSQSNSVVLKSLKSDMANISSALAGNISSLTAAVSAIALALPKMQEDIKALKEDNAMLKETSVSQANSVLLKSLKSDMANISSALVGI